MSMLGILGAASAMQQGQQQKPQSTPTSGPDARMGSNLQITQGTAGPTGTGAAGKTPLPTSVAPGAAENPEAFAPIATAPSPTPAGQPQNIPMGYQGIGNINMGNMGTSTRGSRMQGEKNSQDQINRALMQLQQMTQQSRSNLQRKPAPVVPQITGF